MRSISKMITIRLLRIFIRILYIFPIKENRIIFNAYRGSQYSCNPKYLSEYLVKCFPEKFEIIWAFNEPKQFQFLNNQNIKTVKFSSLKRFYYEATCKVSINNVGSYSWLPLRKGQEHINTWHGGYGYKKIGIGEINNDDLMKKTIKMSSDETSLIPATCQEFYDDVARKDLGYDGEMLKCGFARNDIIFRQREGAIDLRKKVADILHYSINSYVLLYAPTWRYDTYKEPLEFDYSSVIGILKEKYKKNVVILSRMHHLTKSKISHTASVIDATHYPDMQELLCVSDALITDYSSSIWDFSIMEKPIYIYSNDIEEYEKKRGYHVPVAKWGFPVCQSNEELLQAMTKMNNETAKIMARNHRKDAGDYENGTACKSVAEWIVQKCDTTNSNKGRK